jgi:hypothetical protein
VLFLILLFLLRHQIRALLESGAEIAWEFMGNKLVVKPSQAVRPPAGESAESVQLSAIESRDPMPVDYYFINHTSFLRPDKQAEFQARTGIKAPHYDIRVIVDSYYRGALERVKYVKYLLHQAYPEPIQIRSQYANKFLLKELANGEYVLIAQVYLKDRKEPIVLQRYITLYKDGPRLDIPHGA